MDVKLTLSEQGQRAFQNMVLRKTGHNREKVTRGSRKSQHFHNSYSSQIPL